MSSKTVLPRGPEYVPGAEWQRRRDRRRRRVRMVLVVLLPVLALGGAGWLLLPPRLLASRLQAAAKFHAQAPAVHVISWRLTPDGRRTPFAEEWVAGERWRIDRRELGTEYQSAPQRNAVFYRGRLLRWGERISAYYSRPQPVARLVQALLTPLVQSRDLRRIEDGGRESLGGRDCSKLLIHAGSYRHLLWIDRQSNHLVRLRSLRKDHRGWTPAMEHDFDYAVPFPALVPLQGGQSPRARTEHRERLLRKTICQWSVRGETVRLHSVEMNREGDIFLLLGGARPSVVPQVVDDGGTLYCPTYYVVNSGRPHEWTVRHYVRLARSFRPGKRTLLVSLPPDAEAARVTTSSPTCLLVPNYTATSWGWEDLEGYYRRARATARAERLAMVLRDQSAEERLLALETLPGASSVPRDPARSLIAVEEYEKLLVLQDEHALMDGTASLLHESWVDLYRHLKVLGRREESVRALRLAVEALHRPGRIPAHLPELDFEEAIRQEGIPLPPPPDE